jgi:uncharacterized membrane protein YdjX (TVP38/TMEM64 family)
MSDHAKRWLRIGGLVALVSITVVVALVFPVSELAVGLGAWIRDAGIWGGAASAAVYIAATVLMLPGSLLTAGAGRAYGPIWGTLLVSPVSVTAATLAFLLGRTVFRGWIKAKTDRDPRFRAVDAAVGQSGLRIVMLLRLSPAFPFNVLNYALGLTSVRLRDYVLGSFIGMLPGTFLYVYLGSLVSDVAALGAGTPDGGLARQVLSVVGLIATIAVTVYVTRLARRALAAELDGTSPTVANEARG